MRPKQLSAVDERAGTDALQLELFEPQSLSLYYSSTLGTDKYLDGRVGDTPIFRMCSLCACALGFFILLQRWDLNVLLFD